MAMSLIRKWKDEQMAGGYVEICFDVDSSAIVLPYNEWGRIKHEIDDKQEWLEGTDLYGCEYLIRISSVYNVNLVTAEFAIRCNESREEEALRGE